MSLDHETGWSIVESGFNVAHAKAWEGLFTLGSGYLHVRGSLEEHLSDAPQNVTYTRMPANVTAEQFRETKSKWGTYVPGVFGRHPLLNNEMINLPWFLGIAPVIDGERLDVEHCRIESHRRTLHMDTGILARSLMWLTRSGKRVVAEFERFVDAEHPHICVQRLRLTSDADASAEIEAGIDGDVRTNGYDHFAELTFTRIGHNRLGCRVRTDAGDVIEMCSEVSGGDWTYRDAQRSASFNGRLTLQAGRRLTIVKRTAVVTSRDHETRTAGACLDDLETMDYDALQARHAHAWKTRWQTCDVVIEGDPDSQRAMRAALFHLLRAHVTGDPRVAIDAKGYAGEAYWGRYFWDTEMFLLPFFLYTDPQRARTLADFRVQSLPGARENARRYGYPGARYAWESDASGIECCPNWQYADHEVHVTADVAYGLMHYARATHDPAYVQGPPAEVLLETARYWMARIDHRPGEERASLLGVMGPDEYTPISNNNSFTNVMVAEAFRAGAEIGAHAAISRDEIDSFRQTASRLDAIRRSDGLILQCEEFERLAEPRFDELWTDRTRPFASQVSQERLYRTKALKQADVLMLMMLFPQRYSDEEVRQAWDYYLPYTTHDSSLSAGAHAVVACRLGLDEEAWSFWERARAIDLDPVHGGAAEGIHIANAGAVWQMAVLGFAGMRTAMQADTLTLAPRLPRRWSRLAFPLVWQGCPVYVEIAGGTARVSNRGSTALPVTVNREQKTIGAGEWCEWSLDS